MTPNRRWAFTLVELMCVVLMVGILLALLMPGLDSVWAAAYQTRCKSNLHTIYAAQGVWRSEHGDRLLTGGGWMGRLLAYVEDNRSVFQCTGRGVGGADTPPTGGTSDDPYSEMGPEPEPTKEQVEAAFEFFIYWQEGSYYSSSGRRDSGSHIRGELSHVIPLSGDFLVRRKDMGSYTFYEVDDADLTWGPSQPTYDDMKFEIHYDEDRQPVSISIRKIPLTGSNSNRFIIDLQMNGKPIVSDWVKHMGEEISIQPPDNTSGSGSGSGSGWGTGADSDMFILVGDYGLSRGTYETAGRSITRLDCKLFYILDYAKSIADYNKDGDDDDWYQYFIEQPDRWTGDYTGKGDWQDYQALRHFGQANVLFGDGHVESLGPDELAPTGPLWRYFGR